MFFFLYSQASSPCAKRFKLDESERDSKLKPLLSLVWVPTGRVPRLCCLWDGLWLKAEMQSRKTSSLQTSMKPLVS